MILLNHKKMAPSKFKKIVVIALKIIVWSLQSARLKRKYLIYPIESRLNMAKYRHFHRLPRSIPTLKVILCLSPINLNQMRVLFSTNWHKNMCQEEPLDKKWDRKCSLPFREKEVKSKPWEFIEINSSLYPIITHMTSPSKLV